MKEQCARCLKAFEASEVVLRNVGDGEQETVVLCKSCDEHCQRVNNGMSTEQVLQKESSNTDYPKAPTEEIIDGVLCPQCTDTCECRKLLTGYSADVLVTFLDANKIPLCSFFPALVGRYYKELEGERMPTADYDHLLSLVFDKWGKDPALKGLLPRKCVSSNIEVQKPEGIMSMQSTLQAKLDLNLQWFDVQDAEGKTGMPIYLNCPSVCPTSGYCNKLVREASIDAILPNLTRRFVPQCSLFPALIESVWQFQKGEPCPQEVVESIRALQKMHRDSEVQTEVLLADIEDNIIQRKVLLGKPMPKETLRQIYTLLGVPIEDEKAATEKIKSGAVGGKQMPIITTELIDSFLCGNCKAPDKCRALLLKYTPVEIVETMTVDTIPRCCWFAGLVKTYYKKCYRTEMSDEDFDRLDSLLVRVRAFSTYEGTKEAHEQAQSVTAAASPTNAVQADYRYDLMLPRIASYLFPNSTSQQELAKALLNKRVEPITVTYKLAEVLQINMKKDSFATIAHLYAQALHERANKQSQEISESELINNALYHLSKYAAGDKTENHAGLLVWNVLTLSNYYLTQEGRNDR